MDVESVGVPAGTGQHPIPLVVISANNLAASAAFYARVFGWRASPIAPDVSAVLTPAGPTVSLRGNTPTGFPGVVPFIGVPSVQAALEQVVAAGGSIDREPWSVPMAGTLARFKDPSGTIYGLTDGVPPAPMPRLTLPIGTTPKPPSGTVCAIEMYASDGTAAARFFGDLFGWGARETMPQYMGFDPGAGVGGVFQSHTPALPAVAYVYVPDVAGTIATIEAAGGTRVGDPAVVPGYGTFGYFTDPSGTTMALFGR